MLICCVPRICTILLLVTVASGAWADSPFAVDVIDYSPAPGYWVNYPNFDNPAEALGPPEGAGLISGAAPSIVTLGGFGGSITLAFDHTVEDDPLNPFGLDAIVFGNAFWVGDNAATADPNRRWGECATIEIALDTNQNGSPDPEEWHLIPGSHITDPQAQYFVQTWDDDTADPTFPPALASWIPPGLFGIWTTSGYLLPEELFGTVIIENPLASEAVEGIYGYAEYSPTLVLGDTDADDVVDDPSATPESFYTIPDDPLAIGITPGSGGGDAFDIAWAIDPATGAPANLSGFDFIRLTNGVSAVLGPLFEKSPEIDAVADVAPDAFGDYDADGDIDLKDAAGLQICFGRSPAAGNWCERVDRQGDETIDLDDSGAFVERMTGPR